MRRLSPLVLSPILALARLPASAQEATIEAARGSVSIVEWGSTKENPANVGDQLIAGDTVKTGGDGQVHLLLAQGGMILLRPDTTLTISGNAEHARLELKIGEFLAGLKRKLRPRESFEIATPAAVAAVRGTLFWGKSDGEKATTLAGFGRTVSVTAQRKTVTIGAGQKVTVPFGGPPSEPVPHSLPASYLQKFRIGGSLEGLESLVDNDIH